MKDEKLIHIDKRRHLAHVASFLGLGKMNFMDPMVLVEQYLKELSLPLRLVKMMKKRWNVPGLLKMGLYQTPKFIGQVRHQLLKTIDRTLGAVKYKIWFFHFGPRLIHVSSVWSTFPKHFWTI